MKRYGVGPGLAMFALLVVAAGCTGDAAVDTVTAPDSAVSAQQASAIFPGVTGGGTMTCIDGDENEVKVTHGFTLRCDAAPGKLEVNWGTNRFVLKNISDADCEDESGEGPPFATGIDIVGSGKLNGVSGALVCAGFEDGSFADDPDEAELAIIAPGGSINSCEDFDFTGNVVLLCEEDTPLDSGSHVGH